MSKKIKKTDCNKSWCKTEQLSRREYTKNVKQTFLVLCEGSKTEPNYFNKFRVVTATIEVIGLGRNTDDLVEQAYAIYNEYIDSGQDFDQIWCVFDRDSFSSQQFNRALTLARNYNFQVAYSNECFEIWYLLHFHYHNTGISRTQYKTKLTKLLKKKYKKNAEDMYDLLKENQGKAIKHSLNLLSSYQPHNPENDNPCTTVHLLVQELNKYL